MSAAVTANTQEIKDSLKTRLSEAIDNLDAQGLVMFRYSVEPNFIYDYAEKPRMNAVTYYIEYRLVVKDG